MNYRKMIKIVQAEADISMGELAKRLGVKPATIYARIQKNNPPYSELLELASLAGVSVEQVIKWGE